MGSALGGDGPPALGTVQVEENKVYVLPLLPSQSRIGWVLLLSVHVLYDNTLDRQGMTGFGCPGRVLMRTYRHLFLVLTVAMAGCLSLLSCKKGTQYAASLAQGKQARELALEAHRKGNAETALTKYREAEGFLESVTTNNNRYTEEAEMLLLACRRDMRAAEGPKGAAMTILEYLPRPHEVDWDLLVDFDKVAVELLGEETWGRLPDESKARFVQLLKDGGLRFFAEEMLNVGGLDTRLSEPSYEGDEATVELTTRLAGVELDSLMRFKKYGTTWRFYDLDIYAMQATFCQYMARTVELAREGQSYEEYLKREGIEEDLRKYWGEATRDIGAAYKESFQGMVVKVTAEKGAQVSSGSNILGVVPEGTHFKVIQERKTHSGSWLLGQFEIQGVDTHGWVQKKLVDPTEEKG